MFAPTILSLYYYRCFLISCNTYIFPINNIPYFIVFLSKKILPQKANICRPILQPSRAFSRPVFAFQAVVCILYHFVFFWPTIGRKTLKRSFSSVFGSFYRPSRVSPCVLRPYRGGGTLCKV